MVFSQNRGTQHGPPNTIILIMGSPKKVPLILGNPHIGSYHRPYKGESRSLDYGSYTLDPSETNQYWFTVSVDPRTL